MKQFLNAPNETQNINAKSLIKDIYTLSLSVEKNLYSIQRIVGDGVLIVSISAVSAAYSARAIGIVGS